jgi:ATP-dependent exoDNAse (exonuclease V) alpha subunit
MLPTRLTARLLARAEQAGAKVIAVGDPGQLGAVEAGGWLTALTRGETGPTLREVMRQRDRDEQLALQELRDGDPDRTSKTSATRSPSTTPRSTRSSHSPTPGTPSNANTAAARR